ncbi:hypothetical protein [Chamaesiphon polymorphus]|uniref:Uncharacterized protein n=1 Tax=Chamaesiphon polymorphus CCALA 037 TaxID=2107692 RepID=A0A2T1GI09_9CYAN|nr:hypothetical protein [Chamaesiphon polymorphus]PSB57348.1 hypothetical protein C7B77_08760 [Chamaesiphon polymorphus CCALA 037]
MSIKQRHNDRQFALLFIVTSVAICYLAKPAQTQVLVLAESNTYLGESERIDLSAEPLETLLQYSKDNSDFMREQLNSNNSNSSTPLQNPSSGWSQPLGWLFGVMFVILGSLVAWSKYAKK